MWLLRPVLDAKLRLAEKILTFSFCCCTISWHSILNQINEEDEILQNIDTNIIISEVVAMLLNNTVTFLENFLTDEKLKVIFT